MIKIAGRTMTLRDFSLMRKGSPIFYAENFGIEDYGFGRVLMPKNYGNKFFDEDTATITKYAGDIGLVYGVDVVEETTDTPWLYMIDRNSDIFCVKKSTITGQKIKQLNETCLYPDIKAVGIDTNSSVIFSTKDSIGRIFRGRATGGSATELDDTGVDFTTADWDIQAGDYVYNIKDNKLFTIDAGGVAATKLTVTAVDGGDFASGDYYAVINPNWKSLTDDKYKYGRQIIEFDEDFYILNGDYLAIVDSSMAYTAAHKALEAGWVARCGASNGDTLVVGANKNGLGKLFIWDKHSNGWLKKMAIDKEIQSITPYGNSYIYVSGNKLWITDGYNKRKLSTFPGVRESLEVSVLPKGMVVYNDKVVINGGANRENIATSGIWIYDILKDEWTYSPYDPESDGERTNGSGSGIVFWDGEDLFNSFVNSELGWTNQYVLTRFYLDVRGTKGTIITNPIRLGKNARIKKIEINLIQNLKDYGNASSKSKTLTCKLSDCTCPLWRYQVANADSTELDKIQVSGNSASYADAQEGDEILIRDGWNGFLRRRITAIANDGTATEEWTLDSALPNLIKDTTKISVMPFQVYNMDEKTITDETKMLEFYPSFYGDNVMIEIRIDGTENPYIIIESIKIFYE